MEIYEKLDNVIFAALDRIDPKSPTFDDDVEAAKKLLDAKNQEEKTQNDYYVRAEELANETSRIEDEKEKCEKESKWFNKVNWTQVFTTAVTTGTITMAMIVSMAFQKAGYLGLNPLELLKILLNKNK